MSDSIAARVSLSRRDAAEASMCATELANLGFAVLHAGNRGVSFEGSPVLFERVFRSNLELATPTAHFTTEPRIPDSLSRTVESVYFPTPPQRFP